MLTLMRLSIFTALCSIIALTSAHADVEKINYLAALKEEVSESYPDETTVLKVKRNNDSGAAAKKLGPQHLSQDLFMDYMKEKYPASHRVFDRMPIHHQNQVYANFQTHLDINKSRKEMMGLRRNK